MLKILSKRSKKEGEQNGYSKYQQIKDELKQQIISGKFEMAISFYRGWADSDV